MILASDYDGTFFVDKAQTLRNLEAVSRWRKLGNSFGLVTGRSYEMVQLAMKEIPLPLDFLICNNGAAIYRLDGTVMKHSPLNRNRLEEFLELSSVKESPRIFAASSQGTFTVRMEDRSLFGIQLNAPKISIEELLELETIWQFSLGGVSEEKAKDCADEINQCLGEDFTAYYNQNSIDVVRTGISKSSGISQYAAARGDTGEKILVIGDGGNDVDMIRDFHGYAIAGGCEAAKQAASQTVVSVEELIENALQSFLTVV